eukprot:g1501.t1
MGGPRKQRLVESDVRPHDTRLKNQWDLWWGKTRDVARRQIYVEKSPNHVVNSRWMQRVFAVYGKSLFIFTLRHPLSIYENHCNDKVSIALYLENWLSQVETLREDIRHLKQAVVLRYEDWVQDEHIAITIFEKLKQRIFRMGDIQDVWKKHGQRKLMYYHGDRSAPKIIPSVIRFEPVKDDRILRAYEDRLSVFGYSLKMPAFTGACIYAYYEKVDLRIGTCLGFSGIATAKIGMLVNTSVRPQLMRKTVGVCCLLMAPIVAFKDRRKGRKNSADVLAIRKRKTSENDLRSFLNNYYGYVAVGAIAGLCQGLLGIGGGLVQVVCLSSMSTLPQCEIVGTCLASTFIINASAASFYARAGRVNRQAVALIAVSGAISSVLAGAFAIDVDEENLRKWIAAALVVSSVGMIA